MSDKLLAEWFWIDRWMGSSAFLLPQEARGVYREMLTQAWRRGAELPNDHEAIKRATGTTAKEWARAWPLISRFWRVDGDKLVNDTQVEVYAHTKARLDRASSRGRRGAQAKAKAAVLKKCSSSAQAELKQHSRSAQAPLEQNPSTTQAAKRDVLECKPPDPYVRTEKQKTVSQCPPKEPADRRVKEFLTWFQSEYKARRHGADYLVKWDRDGLLVKQMLGATELPRLQKLAQILLSDKTDEAFIAETDRGVGILSVKFNWLSERLAAWEARQKAVSA